MRNFRTLAQAKKDKGRLQDYINLIEHYRPDSAEQYVVFEYALLGSIQKTAENLNKRDISLKGKPFTPDLVKDILTSTPKRDDELHKKIRSLYLKKTRPARRKD